MHSSGPGGWPTAREATQTGGVAHLKRIGPRALAAVLGAGRMLVAVLAQAAWTSSRSGLDHTGGDDGHRAGQAVPDALDRRDRRGSA